MNKKEFYKQLMSEYSFDADKIKENAKRGKSARQKLQPIYIGMSAAAAVCVVTVGTIAAVNLNRSGGVSLTDTGLTQLSASDRLSQALEQLEAERGSSESKDFLVTFSSPLTPAQAQSVLTAYTEGSLPVKQLYFADGSRVFGGEQVGNVFTSGNNYQITGAAIYCSGSIAAELQSDPAVFLVETMEQADFDNAAPVNIEEFSTVDVTIPDTPIVSEPEYTVPTEPLQPGTATSEPTGEAQPTTEQDGTSEDFFPTEEMSGTSEPVSPTDLATYESWPVTEETVPAPDDTEQMPSTGEAGNSVTEPSLPADNTATSEAVPDITEEDPQEQTLPAGVALPENISATNYNTYISADSAFFLNESCFFVKSDSGVALYRYDISGDKLICSEDISDAKLVWVDEDGGKLMVSGMSDYGTRGRTLLLDADNGTITDLHTEDAVMSGILSSVSYNADSRLLVMNIREDGRYYICVSRLNSDGSETFIGTPYESSVKTTVAACKGNTIYLTETEYGETKLIAVDVFTGDVRTVHQFDGTPEMSRNLAFTHAVFAPAADSVIGFTEIFDPETEKLMTLYSSENSVNFGASRHSFISGGSCYTISGGSISESGGISTLASIEYRRSFSEKYAASANGGTVRITDSVYTSANRSSLLTFSEISGNASAEFRQAMNGAIGVNNAIAMKVCATSGMTRPQLVLDCIDYYYSTAAAQKLISRCGIDPQNAALIYNNGGLTAISASDTALVISSQSDSNASGMLYVKAGSFGGKTGYRSVNVSFVKENGLWKLDTVL
ncbi:MAG: hypothetical protein ACI4WS_00845 [Oscillospiraceae bacterium]